MYSLTMHRGKRSVFIGLFPTKYRALVIEANLEWDPSWKPVIERKEVNYAFSQAPRNKPQTVVRRAPG